MSNASVNIDEEKLDAILDVLDQSDRPGGAVGIAIGGVSVYRRGFGLADIERPVTVTPQTQMRIYSITKHFTCLTYMLLCEEGKAQLDDPVQKYMPELHPVTYRATTRQLMSNTSGLRDVCDMRWFFSGTDRTVPAPEQLALYRTISDHNAPPGETWCYNNGGFQMLSEIIQRIADQPLEDVMFERIFRPTGMHATVLRRLDTSSLANCSSAHMYIGEGRYRKKCLPGDLVGEGGVVSTVDDMLRWLEGFRAQTLVSEETWNLLTCSQRLVGGAETGYGLGLYRRPYRGLITVGHPGGGLGGSSQMLRIPQEDLDVVVLVNRGDLSATELAVRLVDACLEREESAPADCAFPIAEGTYRSRTTGRVLRMCQTRGRHFVAIDGPWEYGCVAQDGGTVVPDAATAVWTNMKMSYSKDLLALEYYGAGDELTRVSQEMEPGMSEIVGRYTADSLGVEISIGRDGDRTWMQTNGWFGEAHYNIRALGEGIFSVISVGPDVWGGVLTFGKDMSGMQLRTARTWAVPFRRSA